MQKQLQPTREWMRDSARDEDGVERTRMKQKQMQQQMQQTKAQEIGTWNPAQRQSEWTSQETSASRTSRLLDRRTRRLAFGIDWSASRTQVQRGASACALELRRQHQRATRPRAPSIAIDLGQEAPLSRLQQSWSATAGLVDSMLRRPHVQEVCDWVSQRASQHAWERGISSESENGLAPLRLLRQDQPRQPSQRESLVQRVDSALCLERQLQDWSDSQHRSSV